MKKYILLVVAFSVTVVCMSSCSPAPEGMRDGKYRAEYSEADDHGWKEYVEITVSGETITEVDFDAIGSEGGRKSESQDYEDAMKNAGSAVGPMEYYPALEEQLIAAQKPDEVDGIAGATTSSDSLKKLVKALEKNMSKGDTATVKVKQESK